MISMAWHAAGPRFKAEAGACIIYLSFAAFFTSTDDRVTQI
jgi:hypothetical protein